MNVSVKAASFFPPIKFGKRLKKSGKGTVLMNCGAVLCLCEVSKHFFQITSELCTVLLSLSKFPFEIRNKENKAKQRESIKETAANFLRKENKVITLSGERHHLLYLKY